MPDEDLEELERIADQNDPHVVRSGKKGSKRSLFSRSVITFNRTPKFILSRRGKKQKITLPKIDEALK